MRGSKKVEDGKLVKVDLEYNDKIEKLKIHGDFFVEPPEGLEKIRDNLEGSQAEREKLVRRIESVDAELIGFSAEDLTDAIMEAYKK